MAAVTEAVCHENVRNLTKPNKRLSLKPLKNAFIAVWGEKRTWRQGLAFYNCLTSEGCFFMVGGLRVSIVATLKRVQESPMMLCGFVVHAVAMFWAYFRPAQMDPISQATSITNPTALLFSMGLGAVCLVIGLAFRSAERVVRLPWFLVLMTFVFVAANATQLLFEPSGFWARGLDFVARTAAILLLLGWLVVFNRFTSDDVIRAVPSMTAFAFGLVAFTTFLGPQLRFATVAVCAVVGLGWLLVALGQRTTVAADVSPFSGVDGPQDDGETPSAAMPCGRGRLFGALVASFLLSMMLGALCAFPYANSQLPSEDPFFRYFLLMMGAALLLLSLLSILHPNSPLSNAAVGRLVGIPAALALVVAILAWALALPVGPLLNGMGRVVMDLSLVVAFLLVGRHVRCPLLRIYSLGQAAFMAGNSLGTLLGLGIPHVVPVPNDHILIASVVILILTIEAVFVFVALYRFSLRANGRGNAPDGAAAAAEATTEEAMLAAFACEYQLSDKEAEVLRLFAKGRSRQRIAEIMYVSMGTVNRYFTRLYQKTDVHARQELLDKLEAYKNSGKTL